MKREIRQGLKRDTIFGPRFQHHNIWVDPYTQSIIKDISINNNMDENSVIGLIVEQFIQSGNYLDNSRIRYFNNSMVPLMEDSLKEKYGKSRG